MIIAYKFNPYLFLNVYIINKRMSNIYIDEVMIITEDDNRGSPINISEDDNNPISNALVYTSAGNNGKLVSGYKWLLQISNKSVTQVTLDKKRLRVCTNYIRAYGSFHIVQDGHDYYFDLNDIVVPGDGSIYVGWNSVVDGYTHGNTLVGTSITLIHANSNSNPQYLMDAKVNGNYTVVTAFYLETYSNTYQDSSATDEVDRYGSTSATGNSNDGTLFMAANELYDTLNSNFRETSIKRKAQNDAPATTYNNNHWETGKGTFGLAATATAAGDPHICTLFGENYEFDHLGPIRLFDNEHIRNGDENDLIVINGLVEPGPGRWAKKQYIQKLFIYNAGKTMLVNLGFRGSKVIVESNDGIKYEEEELGFNKDALMYSFDDHARFSDPEDAKEYAELNNVHIPPLVRNKIKFELCGCEEDTKAHKVELVVCLENVNEYNLQPCRLSLDIGNDFNKELATGCLINRKYATHCDLKSLEDISDLPEPTEEELKNMPELEIAPKLINKKYV